MFAGWYTSPEDAAAFDVTIRVNGSDLVACNDREITLHGSWKTPAENAAENAQIPIMMYHQFTTHPDGRLFLPAHSVIITDDDADQTWFDLAAPVVDKYGLLSTSFMITADRQDPAPNAYVLRRSHTHDMHQAGENGQGRMANWTADQIAADLEASAAVLGVKEVVAYPYGHYNDTTRQGVAQAGFEMGRTIDPGCVHIGTDKLALPVVRIDYGMGLDAVIGLIG